MIRPVLSTGVLFLLAHLGSVACGDASSPPPLEVRAGEGVDNVTLGLSFSELRERIGEPDTSVVNARNVIARYDALGLEVILVSGRDTELSEDAVVVAVGARAGGRFSGPVIPGSTPAEVEATLGAPSAVVGEQAFFESGVSVLYENGVAKLVGVYPPYVNQPDPPPMQTATQRRLAAPPRPPVPAAKNLDLDALEIFDVHLHIGRYEHMNRTGKELIMAALPDFVRPYAPPLMSLGVDAWGQHVGIAEQLHMANIRRGLLVSVYSHHTTGYATNQQLIETLLDPRNEAPDGDPIFWGLASINFDDFDDASLVEHRLNAVRSYLETFPEQLRGIKLAHAHQGIAFDDVAYHGIYDVAADMNVPVLLHTGFSPFPGSMDTPEYYDPSYLEDVVNAYDGREGRPRVDFVFAHTGQGDVRSVDASLRMCGDYDNVHLDISALGRALLRDEDGVDLTPEQQAQPQYATQLPYVLAAVLELELVDRTLFATDGAQFSGMVRSYLTTVVSEMEALDYTQDQARKVLGENAMRLFLNR